MGTRAKYSTLLDLLRPTGGGSPQYEAIREGYPWVRDMASCPQHSVHHAEGDVWTHTRMVMEEILAAPEWQALPPNLQETLLVAALLHDVGKPDTLTQEEGEWRAPGHSRRGEVLSRRILWEMEAPLEIREAVAQLVRFHQRPFWLFEAPRPHREARMMSWSVRLDLLWILAQADARGRISRNAGDYETSLGLFRLIGEEAECFHSPFPFASSQSRMEWVRAPERDPYYHAHDGNRGEMIMVSGLPGTGKSRWVQEHLGGLPLAGYDEVRRDLGLPPGSTDGRVLQEGRERIRVQLRERTRFVFNSTALTRRLRSQLIDLAMDYGARIRIIHFEASPEIQAAWNAGRSSAVPPDAIARMLNRWETPTAAEAHWVEAVVSRERSENTPIPIVPWGT